MMRSRRPNVLNGYGRLALIGHSLSNTVHPQATQIGYSEGVKHGNEVMLLIAICIFLAACSSELTTVHTKHDSTPRASEIIWSVDTNGRETVIAVRCSPSGGLLSAAITRYSGNSAWDEAALRAVQRSDPMPLNIDDETPVSITIPLRPAG